MKVRFTALAPLVLPLVALAAACSSASHAPRSSTQSALGAPGLGKAASFAVLGGSTVTSSGPSTVAGDVGVSPGTAVTGFPPALQTAGSMHAADAVALEAKNDLGTAYDSLAAEPCTRDLSGTDLGGLTLGSGVYCFTSSAQLTGTLTLDAKGKSDAVFVFKTVSKLTTASSASVVLINGGSGCRVFWQVGSSATIATGSSFVGSILALTSIALESGASLDGRALARNGAVTLDDNRIALATCTPSDAGVDAGASDAGPADSGRTDAGPPAADAGPEADAAAETDTAAPPCDDTEGYCY